MYNDDRYDRYNNETNVQRHARAVSAHNDYLYERRRQEIREENDSLASDLLDAIDKAIAPLFDPPVQEAGFFNFVAAPSFGTPLVAVMPTLSDIG